MADQPVMYMCSKCSQLYSDLEEFKSHECMTGDEIYMPEGEGEGVDSGLVDQQEYQEEGQQYQADMGELEAQPPEELMEQIQDQTMEESAEMTQEQESASFEPESIGLEEQQDFWTEEMVTVLLESLKSNIKEGKFGANLWSSVSDEVITSAKVPADPATPEGVKEKWIELMKEYIQHRSSNQAHLSPFSADLEFFYENHRQVYIDAEKGETQRSPFWSQSKTLDLVRIMSREKSKFTTDSRGRLALYGQVAAILSKQHGGAITATQVKSKFNRLSSMYQKNTGNKGEVEDSGFYDHLLSYIVEEGGEEEENGGEEEEDEFKEEAQPSGDEDYKVAPAKKAAKPATKAISRPAQPASAQKKAVKTKWSLELAKVLITIVKEHHKLLETGATSESQFFEHCSKWLKERSASDIDGPTLQTKYNRMRSEFDTYLMRQGEKPKEMPMSQYLARMEAKLKEHVETPRGKAATAAPSAPAAAPPLPPPVTPSTSEEIGFHWDDKSTRMFLRILRHFTKAVEANEITIDQVCKDAADILQSYVKLNVTGDQCRRRWQALTSKHRDTSKGAGKQPTTFAKSLSILEKAFGIEKMEEGEKAASVTEELNQEEAKTSDLLKNRPGITLSKVAPKEPAASGSGCTNCGRFDKVLSTLLKDEREMRKKEHDSMIRVMKDQTDALVGLKGAITALQKVCAHISTAQDNINKQLPKLATAGKRVRDDDTPENRNARRRRTGGD